VIYHQLSAIKVWKGTQYCIYLLTYESTTEYIINHITRTFPFGQDIACLEHLEEYDVLQHKPTLKRSESYDEEISEMEDKKFQIEFQAEYDNFMKRKQHYETNICSSSVVTVPVHRNKIFWLLFHCGCCSSVVAVPVWLLFQCTETKYYLSHFHCTVTKLLRIFQW
jgi:hypothetical protein